MTRVENRQTAVFIEKYYQSLDEFENLNRLHQLITVLISIITLGIETKNTIAKYRITELKLAFEQYSDSKCLTTHAKLWENFLFNHDKIKSIVQKIAIENKIEDLSQECSLFFEEYKKEMKLKLTDEQAVFLFKLLQEKIEDEFDPVRSKYSLSADKVLKVYKTRGDGSCAFHALIGQFIDGEYRCNEKEARKRFCDYLRNSFENDSNPFDEGGRLERIGGLLDDLIEVELKDLEKNEKVPGKFKSLTFIHRNRVVNVFEAYVTRYRELISLREQRKSDPLVFKKMNNKIDKLKSAFKKDECVFQAYLDYIGTDGVSLSLNELITAADCLNKRLYYFDESGRDSEEAINHLSDVTAEKVYVFHCKEAKHYERAEIIDLRS